MTTMAPMHASPFFFYSLFCSLGIVWQQDIYPWPCCARPAGHFSGRGHATWPSCDLTSKGRLSNRLVAYIDIYTFSVLNCRPFDSFDFTTYSFDLSATSQQYFSLRTNQSPTNSQQYFSLKTNQHQPLAKQTDRKFDRLSY
jgi:hypothetical protein